MAKTSGGAAWERGFRAAVRAGKPGWTVLNNRGRMLLVWRPIGTKEKHTVALPVDWLPGETNRALLLINKIAKLVLTGEQDTLKGALAVAQDSSGTMRRKIDWSVVVEGLRASLQQGRNEIQDSSWKANYQRYCEKAVKVIQAGDATDGYSLLKEVLKRWEGKPPSRDACCVALRNLTDHAIARHGAALCWRIDRATIVELKGKAAKKRIKATLNDTEMLALIEGVASRNPEWANVLRLLCLFGLRPVELQHLQPKKRDDGSLGLWCSYEKNCGGTLTNQRWLEPLPIADNDGKPVQWHLIELMHAGLLELPLGNDGHPRSLNGHYVEQFLKRQPEWKELKQQCEARGEWLRPYSFRDSFSLRGHRQNVEVGAIADAMGHSLQVHCRSYRWASSETTRAAFAAAFTTQQYQI